MDKQPIAWMRKWAFEGEKPYKVKNPDSGRMGLAFKFKLNEVTRQKCLSDDVPLYAEPSND